MSGVGASACLSFAVACVGTHPLLSVSIVGGELFGKRVTQRLPLASRRACAGGARHQCLVPSPPPSAADELADHVSRHLDTLVAQADRLELDLDLCSLLRVHPIPARGA